MEANEYVNMVRKALLHKQDREKQAYEMFLLTNGKTQAYEMFLLTNGKTKEL
jgi:hypothetical protein